MNGLALCSWCFSGHSRVPGNYIGPTASEPFRLKAEATDQQLAEEEMDSAAAILATLTDLQRLDLIRTRTFRRSWSSLRMIRA